MSWIVTAAWFVLLLAASGAPIASDRSLLSSLDVENIRAAKAYAAGCKMLPDKVGTIHTHVYHIYAGGSGYGLQEHNAGDSPGDLSFIFPRGFKAYYKGGYVAMLHIGVTQWGRYLRCNHPDGSHVYSCEGGAYAYAGRQKVTWNHGGYWYSFPALGKNKQWSESDAKSGQCMMIRIKAKCLFNLVAVAGGKCPKGCDALTYDQCSQCIVQGALSYAQLKEVWDNAIWNKKCHRYETEVEDELDALHRDSDLEVTFTNTSRSEAPRSPRSGHGREAQTLDDSFTDTSRPNSLGTPHRASTDKGVVVV